MFELFQSGLPLGQGVLAVDATHLVPFSDCPPSPQPVSNQIYTTLLVLPGDVDIPKPPK